jgi:chemotaxis protein histidine kinase CheA
MKFRHVKQFLHALAVCAVSVYLATCATQEAREPAPEQPEPEAPAAEEPAEEAPAAEEPASQQEPSSQETSEADAQSDGSAEEDTAEEPEESTQTPSEDQETESAAKQEDQEQASDDEQSAESSEEFVEVSEAEYEKTFSEVEKTIERLNEIIRERNFTEWKKLLTERYIDTFSDSDRLAKISETPVMRRNDIELTSLRDYFRWVVVPSRANARLDDLNFISEDQVEAIMKVNGRRVILYELREVDGAWKVDVT